MTFKSVAAALFTFAKPDVTKQVIDSILQNRDYDYEIDWHVFHDGAVNRISGVRYADDATVKETLKVVTDSELPYRSITVNKYNENIVWQKHRAFQLFKYHDLVYFFEDDLLLGNYYLRLLKILAESFPQHIGMLYKRSNNGKHHVVFPDGGPLIWGSYMPVGVYNKIKGDWNRYYNRMKNVDYIKQKRSSLGQAHDINLAKMIQKAGVQKLWPCVTRARNIGQYGHITYLKGGSQWEKDKLPLQPTKISYPEHDKTITRFVLR